MTTDYRLSPPIVARVMGVLLAVLGSLVFLVTAAVGLLKLPIVVLSLAVVGAVVAIFVVGYLLTRTLVVVRLDETGYQVRLVRGAGVKQAQWTEVEDVVAATVADERCVVMRLRDGRTTTVPMRVLAGGTDSFLRELRSRLDTGHGYRRLR